MLGKIGVNGAKAVQLFFILSAYLSLLSIEKVPILEDGSYEKLELKKWYRKRMCRLLPLYWIYILLFLILNGRSTPYWCGGLSKISAVNIICNICLLNGWNPWYINTFSVTWYMADLAILIFITPFIYRAIKTAAQAVSLTCIVIAVSSVLCAFLSKLSFLFMDGYVWDAYWSTFCVFAESPLFCYGICLYYCDRSGKFDVVKGNKSMHVGFLLLSVVIIGNACIYPQQGILSLSLWGIAFLGIIISLMICPLRAISNNSILIFLGKYSYGIYLTHWIVYYYLIETLLDDKVRLINSTLSWLIVYIFVLCFSSFISVIGSKWIENTIIRLVEKNHII